MGKLIAVFATEISSRIQGNLYRRLHKRAALEGYNLVFFSANLERLHAEKTDNEAYSLFEIAENMDFSAFIIHAQSINNKEIIDRLIAMGKKKNIPIIVYDCDNIGFTKEDGIVTINLDYKQGFAEGVKHLIEHHGCKDIFMLAGIQGNKFSMDREDAYKQEMTAHGLVVSEDMIGYGNFWELPATEVIEGLINSGKPLPEAICCANDSMAIAAAKAFEIRGIKVPEDVLITGFDGIEDGKFNSPVISTCEPIMDVVPDFVFDAIKNDLRVGEYFIPLRFLPRESCGCENEYDEDDRIEVARIMENARQNAWQHGMLSNMQLDLMDSCEFEDISNYMSGIIGVYKGFSHLYCIRDNIEFLSDYSEKFEGMRIYMNLDFLPEKDYGIFSVRDVIPEYKSVFENAGAEDIFVFRMFRSVTKKYGYSIIKAPQFLTNEIRIFGQFSESYTNMLENILRNRRLDQANQKLSEMYEQMSEIYIRDVLTGLYNRNGYYQKLDDYITREDLANGYMHLFSIDMDGMKRINDTFGHQEGDVAIKSVAKAINDCFAQPCVGARFGGDEFVVALFTGSESTPLVENISLRLNNYLKSLPSLQGKGYTVAVSVGHAVSKVSDIVDIEAVEKLADDSMYENKRIRKGIK